jgi:uncharacterized membrane protein YfcA
MQIAGALQIAIDTAVTAFAALVHGTIGIGFPLIATPLLALFSDVRTAMLLLVVPTMVINFCFLFGKLVQGLVFTHAGLMTRTVITESLPLAVVGLAVMLAGMRLRERIPLKVYRKWLRILLALLAGFLMIQFVAHR